MTRPLRVFLCHASQDKPAVRRLHRYLKQHGIQPWLDELDLLPGENWEVEIPRALNASDVILVCLSKNSVNKEGYVQKEISFALDKALEKPDGTIFIIPAKLEACDVPSRLNRYQWVDLFRPDSYKRLLLGLNKRAIDLGADVAPVILEDTRQRKSNLKPVDINQIDRDTQEKIVEKADGEIIEEAWREKASREKLEFETAEKDRLEKVEREKAQIEAADAARIAREKLELEAAEKNRLEKAQREKEKREAKEKTARERKPALKINPRLLGVGGIILLVLLFIILGGNYLAKNIPSATQTPFVTASATLQPPTPTRTKIPTSTLVPPTPILEPGATMIGEKGQTLVYVPAGEFTMGNDISDAPIHTVYLDAFWIDQTEVTNKQYKACVDAGTCEPPSDISSHAHPSYYGNSEFDNYPVMYVNWDKANRYCKVWTETGGSLPTEAQWEKAAQDDDRRTYQRTYPWGEDISCEKANYYDYDGNKSCIGDTTPVGSYPDGASFYGAYDMAGNVWEWVNDWYSDTYYKNSSSSNPQGPDTGQYRVLRGGSWYDNDSYARSASRDGYDPSFTNLSIGFRCARSP